MAYPEGIGPGASGPTQAVTYFFDFSEIPAGASITGVTDRVRCRNPLGGGSSVVSDRECRLVVGGDPVGANRSLTGGWPADFAYRDHGGDSDTGGYPLTVAEAVAEGFGVRLSVDLADDDMSGIDAQLDHVERIVHYEE